MSHSQALTAERQPQPHRRSRHEHDEAQAVPRRVPVPAAVLRRLHHDARDPPRLRGIPQPVREQAGRRRGVQRPRQLRPSAHRSAVPAGPRPGRPLLHRPGADHARPRPLLRSRARQLPRQGIEGDPPAHLHALRRARRGRDAHVGIPLRTRLRPARADVAGARLRDARVPLGREHARLDDEHRHVGVRRLQHDHHVRGPPVDPHRAVRGRRDRRRRTVPARLEHQDPGHPSGDPADDHLLDHRRPSSCSPSRACCRSSRPTW